MTKKKLGKNQLGVLDMIEKRGGTYHIHCGVLWGTESNTQRIIDSLAKHGLIEAVGWSPETRSYTPEALMRGHTPLPYWNLTEAGKAALKEGVTTECE